MLQPMYKLFGYMDIDMDRALVAALQWPKMTRPVPRELYMEEQAR